MLKYNKDIEEVKKEINSIPCKLDSKIAELIIDNVHSTLPDNFTKVEIANVLNAFLKYTRVWSAIRDNFYLEGLFLNLKIVKAGRIIKFVFLPDNKIKNNVECYVDEIM